MKYQLTLTENQLGVIQQALDMYYRVGMGQLREVTDHLIPPGLAIEEYCKRRDSVESVLASAKLLAMPDLPLNAYHGIASQQIHESNRTACDIYKVIRSHTAWEAHPEGGILVCFDEVYQLAKEPLPRIKTIGKKK